MARRSILRRVSDYYSNKLALHGTTARGVDWNSAESQQLRFAQLAKLLPSDAAFSLNDIGCGYGALYDYLLDQEYDVRYRGYDVSPAMVQAARKMPRPAPRPVFVSTSAALRKSDYAVASGLFNVRLDVAKSEWRAYVDSIIGLLHRTSRRGFAFNCLTSYSDPRRRRADLYYGDPRRFFHHCVSRYSRHVALLHDYGLFEFTILVRK
jgi:SAM-dependent methyltransferase